MVIGNFALLAGLDPAAVHRWNLGAYFDAFEGVELPNTLGMSQFADGGLVATEPYVSSAAYIDRMSGYCKGCPYDKKLRTGERACPYNSLYRDFFARNTGKKSRPIRAWAWSIDSGRKWMRRRGVRYGSGRTSYATRWIACDPLVRMVYFHRKEIRQRFDLPGTGLGLAIPARLAFNS